MTQPARARHAHGVELEVYFVLAEDHASETAVTSLLERLKLGQTDTGRDARIEVYRREAAPPHAARLTLDADPGHALAALRDHLPTLRWLEVGLRAYGVIEGKREPRPWRRNAYLSLEQFRALEALEPEVRYHAPG